MTQAFDPANSIPQWKIDLIRGFPWESDDPDGDLQRSFAALEADLLYNEKTEPGSNDEYEYGESVFRLTVLGKEAMSIAHPIPTKNGLAAGSHQAAKDLKGFFEAVKSYDKSENDLIPASEVQPLVDALEKAKRNIEYIRKNYLPKTGDEALRPDQFTSVSLGRIDQALSDWQKKRGA